MWVLLLAILPDTVTFLFRGISPGSEILKSGIRSYIRKRAKRLGVSFLGMVSALYIIDILNHDLSSFSKMSVALLVVFIVLCGYEWGRYSRREGPMGTQQALSEEMAKAQALEQQLRNLSRETIFFANYPLSSKAEVEHFKVIGSLSDSRSSIFRIMMQGALMRGDRFIVLDPEANYLSTFYQPKRGDIVLNPFDKRSPGWSLIKEIHALEDVEGIVEALIPSSVESIEWIEPLRRYVSALLSYCKQTGKSSETFYFYAMNASVDELRDILVGTPAASCCEDVSVLSALRQVATHYLTQLKPVLHSDFGSALSIREWVRSGAKENTKGCLFLTCSADQIPALSGLIVFWLRLAMGEMLRLPEQDNHMWCFVDQFDVLGRIEDLRMTLDRLKKVGARIVVGIESIAQMRAVYNDEATSIMDKCGNTLILKCPARGEGETSVFAQALLGDQPRAFMTVNFNLERNRNECLPSLTPHTVRAWELEQLPDRRGYVKIADMQEWLKVSFGVYPLPTVTEPFIPIIEKTGNNYSGLR